MKLSLKYPLHAKACSLVASTIALATIGASTVAADQVRVFNEIVSGVPAASPEIITDNVISPEFAPDLVEQGIDLLENPSGVITRFGNLSDGSRTEPDENTYLILDHNPGGPTEGYDYGRHFLFQGHEMPNGNTNRAYVTRINLDVAHPDHRITLMTPGDANAITGFNSIDGSTWNPFSQTLLFTQEAGNLLGTGTGGVIDRGPDCAQNDGRGNRLRRL